MSCRKKIGWRGPLRDPVSLMTGAVIESGAAACWACGLGPVNASTAASPPTPTPPNTIANLRIIDPALSGRRVSRAPKHSPDLAPHNPIPAPIPMISFGFHVVEMPARRSLRAPRPVRRGALAQPLSLPAGEAEEPIHRPSIPELQPAPANRPGPLRLGHRLGDVGGEPRDRPDPTLLHVAQGEGGGDPVPDHVQPAELPVADGVLPGPPPAHPHVPHRLDRPGDPEQPGAHR